MLVGSLFVFWVFFLFIFYAKRIDHHVNMAVNQAFNESGTTGSVTYCSSWASILIPHFDSRF